MGLTACKERQCLYKGDLYLYFTMEREAHYESIYKKLVGGRFRDNNVKISIRH